MRDRIGFKVNGAELVDKIERTLHSPNAEHLCYKRVVVCVGVKRGILTEIGTNKHAYGICDCFNVYPDQSETAIHAEQSAIDAGCDAIYVTYQPCEMCAHAIVAGGTIKYVAYRDKDSKDDDASINYLRSHGIEVEQW